MNHHWFRVAYIILCYLKKTNSQILPTKIIAANPIVDYQQEKKKKKKKKFKPFAQTLTRNFSWISFSCIIYRMSTDHAQID